MQRWTRLGHGGQPSVHTHAALLNRAPAHQAAANGPLLAQLQRQYGNHYVNQVVKLSRQRDGTAPSAATEAPKLQPKLTIGPAGDRYEREADRVAAAVVQQLNNPAAQQAGETPPVQRRAEPDGLQTKPLISTIQRVATKAGTEEEDKDKLAQKKPAGPDHAKKLDEEEDKHLVQKKPAMDASAMKEPPEEEEEQLPAQRKAVVQRLATGAEPATAQVEGSIKQARGQGRPLPDQFRSSIEQAFGADFSGVRIHTDDRADRLNQAVQARAFTTGQDIFLRPGEYALGSKRGQELLAHELTHVVQQNGSAVQPKGNRSDEAGQQTLIAEGEAAEPVLPEPTTAQEVPQQEPAADAAPTSPESDPGFQDVVNQAHGVGAQQKEHPPAEQKSQEAQMAAEPPSNEVESKAQDKQVDAMEAAPTPPFDAPAFKKALMERIAAITPKNLEEADQFKGSSKLESVKNDVTGKVDEAQKGSQGPLEETAKAAPDASGIPPKPVTPLPGNHPGETPSIAGAEQAAPKPKGQSQVEAPAQARSQALDQQLADAQITEEQLANSNEPEFQAALASKSTAQTHSQTAPQAYRQGEQSQLTQAQSTAAATAQEKLQGMHGERSQSLEQVTGQQQEGKGKDEQSRARIAGDINKIYQKTKSKVDGKLSKLTTDVSSAFDAGATEARRAFEGFVGKRMDDYKAARYTTSWSNPFGWANWLHDKLLGMPEEVNRFYEEGRDLYIKQMDGVIDQVVAIVGAGLSEAKNDVAEGRKQVKDYVAKLPEDLKQVGVEAAQNIQSQFAGLEQEIDSKKDELVDTLAQKYKESLEVVDARIKEMQEENKGLIQKAVDAIASVIKTIIELTNLLLQVLARVVDAIGTILKDPIGFLGNLFNAIKQGFLNFVKNIGRYLSEGLLGWLTGTLAGANIQMPRNLDDSQGIFGMVMGVLGITYEAIRARAVRRLGRDGEQKAGYLEKSFEMFRILATQGVDGVWQVIKDRLGDLKKMVLDPITHFLTTSVIEAGVGLIIGMMTPASAFIRACKAIYDIVKFFIDHAQQLADLINSILDAVGLVASGGIEQASQKVEHTLAKAIPMAIGFMASILGLGNISQRVQALLQKMRRPIDRAIDWVIDQGVKFSKRIGIAKGKRNKKVKDRQLSNKEQHDAHVKEGLAAIDIEESRYLKESKIAKKDAEKVASIVKNKYPIFKVLTVTDGGKTWDYSYVASPLKRKRGEYKKTGVWVDFSKDKPGNLVFMEEEQDPTKRLVDPLNKGTSVWIEEPKDFVRFKNSGKLHPSKDPSNPKTIGGLSRHRDARTDQKLRQWDVGQYEELKKYKARYGSIQQDRDHIPSGESRKIAFDSNKLTGFKNAQDAYNKTLAITINKVHHQKLSRTYGGRQRIVEEGTGMERKSLDAENQSVAVEKDIGAMLTGLGGDLSFEAVGGYRYLYKRMVSREKYIEQSGKIEQSLRDALRKAK